jgi:hypothetical protein
MKALALTFTLAFAVMGVTANSGYADGRRRV